MDGDEGLGFKGTTPTPTPSTAKPGGLTNMAGVTPVLCESYRAHLETKIEDMETRIKSAVYLAGFIMTVVQFALHFLG